MDRNSEKFLAIYNELDQYMRKYLYENEDKRPSHYDLIHGMTRNNRISKLNEKDLQDYADLRNTIVHDSYKVNMDCIAEPHDNIVKNYEKILKAIKNPPIALKTIAIEAKDIYFTSMDDIALDVIKEMNRNTYTHVPVFEDGKMIGIFSENTIISYIASIEDVMIEKEALIRVFAEFLPINNHGSECFEFVNRNALVVDIEEKFRNGFKDKKRVAVVFITETGKENEKLLGLVTAWDLAGYDKYNN